MYINFHIYRMQRSCAKVIFSQVSVNRGVSASVHAGIHPRQTPPRQTSPRDKTPSGQTPVQTLTSYVANKEGNHKCMEYKSDNNANITNFVRL